MSQTSLKISALKDYQNRIEQSNKDTDGFTVVRKKQYNHHKPSFEPSNSDKTSLFDQRQDHHKMRSTYGKTESTSGKTDEQRSSVSTPTKVGCKTELTSGKTAEQKQENYSVFSPNTTNVEFEQSKRFIGLSSLKKTQDDRKKAYEDKKSMNQYQGTQNSSRNFSLLYSLKKEQDQKYEDRLEARSHMYFRPQETDHKSIIETKQFQEPLNIEDKQSFPSLEIKVQAQNQVTSWSQKIATKDEKITEKEPLKPSIAKLSEVKPIAVEISIISDKSIVYDDLLDASKLVETPSFQDADNDFTVVKSLKQKKVYY
jgi:hypothetical protein